MSAADVSSDVETIRAFACPNWPHLGIIGCEYCARAEEHGVFDALDRLAARAAGRENVTEALKHYADETNWEIDPDTYSAANTAGYVCWDWVGGGEEPWRVARAALDEDGTAGRDNVMEAARAVMAEIEDDLPHKCLICAMPEAEHVEGCPVPVLRAALDEAGEGERGADYARPPGLDG